MRLFNVINKDKKDSEVRAHMRQKEKNNTEIRGADAASSWSVIDQLSCKKLCRRHFRKVVEKAFTDSNLVLIRQYSEVKASTSY